MHPPTTTTSGMNPGEIQFIVYMSAREFVCIYMFAATDTPALVTNHTLGWA